MDPQTTWEQLLAAYAEGDWDTVEQRVTDLTAWLDRDGFPPSILNHAGLDPDWNRALARAGCAHALGVLHDQWRVQGSAFPP
ncbi:MAG: hypothetical protein HY289_01110 [Planctomycetes bacterium]|nr:hypothetical protein [Planctomycetota bacterium]